ncbi:glycosyltransferase family A protein [Algiphilus sp.]|uniref:glycosyltransferase family 2 protein n=1 Tax=Algiphilus sp. TaxID=1872431 RepID=UPI002A5E93F0|nr:glycosyltransferase family 2 protein [Pseudomonadota bacterium]
MQSIFVFSFNRGPYLENCIASIAHCAPDAEVTIYDDASDDPETLRVLERLEARCRIVRRTQSTKARHGSLYGNMQAALDSVTDGRVIAFLQDDTQMIRPFEEADRQFVARHFERHPDAAFLAPVFLRGTIRPRRLAQFEYDIEAQVYRFVQDGQKVAGTYYSDIALIHTGRLHAIDWRFQGDEFENELQAQRHFGRMGYMRDPFAMWVPNARAYRNRSKTLAFRLGEHFSRSGLYPLHILEREAVAAMRQRDAATEKPLPERFLRLAEGNLPEPWPFNPLKRSRLLRRLNEFEEWLKRLRRSDSEDTAQP